MQVNPDGTFYLNDGEAFPFVCPVCDLPIAYDPNVIMVYCPRCTYLGELTEFATNIGPVL